MYAVTVCIICAIAVVALAGVLFAIAVAAVTISDNVAQAYAALRAFWRDRIAASLFHVRLSPRLSPHRARQV